MISLSFPCALFLLLVDVKSLHLVGRRPNVLAARRNARNFVRRATPVSRIIPLTAEEIQATTPMTYDDIGSAAAYWGCKIDLIELGPAYRVELRKTPWRRTDLVPGETRDGYVNTDTGEYSSSVPKDLMFTRRVGSPVGDTDDVIMMEDRDLVGYTNGFAQLGGVLHCDTMQIRRFSGYYSKRGQGSLQTSNRVPNPGVYGLGMLLGGVCCLFGLEQGSTRAELLAIMDDERQHRILVRYYKRLGFKAVREVGDDLSSFGDRLSWGGVGTLMNTELDQWSRKWAPVIRDPGCGLL